MKGNLARILFFLYLLPSAAGADWLAFKDGTTREIVGHWKIQGKQVIFKALGGTLSSVRLEEVDLPASEQLSKNAETDRGLVEIKSSPTVAPTWTPFNQKEPLLLEAGGEQFIADWSDFYYYPRYWQKYPGSHKGESCVPGRLVGTASGVDWWLQIGTKVSKFRLIGLEWADLDHLKKLVPDGSVCLEIEPWGSGNEPTGLSGYARLADGRDIGLELVRARAAKIADKAFSRRETYLAATAE